MGCGGMGGDAEVWLLLPKADCCRGVAGNVKAWRISAGLWCAAEVWGTVEGVKDLWGCCGGAVKM